MARLAYADRDKPVGKVKKWHNGSWSEPGWWGHGTPVFPAARDFTKHNASMFWGPAIHWNTHLQMYVMLLNHLDDPTMATTGIYVSYNRDLADPAGWSKPQQILDREGILRAATTGAIVAGGMLLPRDPAVGGSSFRSGDGAVVVDPRTLGWFPQIIGIERGETDKLCGRTGRFFVNGISALEVAFLKPGEQLR